MREANSLVRADLFQGRIVALLYIHRCRVQAGISLTGHGASGTRVAEAECPVPLICCVTADEHHLSNSVTFSASDSGFQAGFGSASSILQMGKLREELRGTEQGTAPNPRLI